MPSSGTTALETSGDAPIVAISSAQLSAGTWFNVVIVNTGDDVGFFSLNGGADWNYLTAQVSSVPGGVFLNNVRMGFGNEVLIKRVPGGADMTGIFVSVL